MAVITELRWKVTWVFNNHLTSHLPVGVSIQFPIHRHSFLLALGLLDTQLHTPPSVATGGLLSPNIPAPPPLLSLTKQLFWVVQDWVSRVSEPPPSPSSTRWHDARACQVLCSRLNWTYSRDGIATFVAVMPLCAPLSALYNDFLCSLSVSPP